VGRGGGVYVLYAQISIQGVEYAFIVI
jgi:hypothetical protein